MRVLVIDSNRAMREFLKKKLQTECYVVDTSGDGEDGSYLGRVHDYDLILIGDPTARKQSLDITSEIRKTGKTAPIIISSTDTNIDYKVRLLNAGADDYLVRPFEFRELSSRMRALLRRPKSLLPDVLEVDNFALDIRCQKARFGNKMIYFTRKEFALVEYLMRNCGAVVSRGELFEHVWDQEADPFSNTIESHILNVRRKIERWSRRKFIHTVPGRGYKIE